MKNLIITAFMLTSVSAYPMAAWNEQNDPKLINFDYQTKFSELPLKGALTKRPWSGDYWPTYTGGITYRWGMGQGNSIQRYSYSLPKMNLLTDEQIKYLSPAEKYDLFLGDDEFSLTQFERERTQVLATIPGPSFNPEVKIEKWEGLCHAWAPATVGYDNPRPIYVEGARGHMIPFGSSDLKALLTYNIHVNQKDTNTKFLGSRCYLNFKDLIAQYNSGDITFDELDQKIAILEAQNSDTTAKGSCMDTNAGSFHVVLSNQIGLMDESFIIDRTRDLEVWNQPVYSFD
jgi:hypothetical protein